jgi:hypothetical protein
MRRFRVTMGSMSASDAAPLPRLGEVFFDVRGNARNMRLSWYADTGVAVFSIWQAGTCTGTFRLPMGDLARMIETLSSGPDDGLARPDQQAQYRGPQAPGSQWDDYGTDYGPDPLYPPGPVPGRYRAGGGSADFTGERTQAHYLPDAAWSGYDPETGTTAAVSDGGNSTALPYSGSQRRPPESFPYGSPVGYEAIATHRGGPDLPLR